MQPTQTMHNTEAAVFCTKDQHARTMLAKMETLQKAALPNCLLVCFNGFSSVILKVLQQQLELISACKSDCMNLEDHCWPHIAMTKVSGVPT